MKFMKKNLFRHLFTFMLALTLVLGAGVTTVYAADTFMADYDFNGDGAVPDTIDPNTWQTSNPGTYTVKRSGTYNYTYYVTVDADGKVSKINTIDSTGNSVSGAVNPFKMMQLDGSQQAMDAIQDIKDLTNVHADLGAAQGTLEPIIEIVNTAIGILATAILILVGLFTAIDILYLEVPAFHASMDQKGMEKGQTNKSGGPKAKIVSEDASQAYQEAQETGKNPMIVYLKKRIVAYVAVAIVLYMLLSGNLSLIIEVILKMLNGVFGWVEDYSATM